MPLALYMDVHVPAAITEGLRLRGLDVLTSQEDGTRELDDEKLLARATEMDRLLFSQDRDLLRIASEWQRIVRPFLGVAYAPQVGISIGQLIEDLQLIATCCRADELFNRVTYLPLQ